VERLRLGDRPTEQPRQGSCIPVADTHTDVDTDTPVDSGTPVDTGTCPRWSANPALVLVAFVAIGAGWHVVPGAVIFLGILSALVTIHEGAHLLAARWRGMHASEFAIGFGPRVVSVQVGELEVAWRLVPAGGFVRITGMRRDESVDPVLEPRTYRAGSLGSKLAVVAAGPAANLVAGFLIAVVAFGVATPAESRSDNPVAEAASWSASLFTMSFEGYGQLAASVHEYPEMVASQGESGDGARVMSPVLASRLSEQAAEAGVVWLLLFAALISIALGAFNALPFPPLDGGHAAVAVIERVGSAISNREFVLSVWAQSVASYALLAFLVTLSLTAVYLDVVSPLPSPFEG
jgi:membrane-associated protease RseP (regulator of RpoE activity)